MSRDVRLLAELWRATLGHANVASAASVRTHLGNLRRKAVVVGLSRLVTTWARRGCYAENLSIRAAGQKDRGEA